MKPKVIIEVRGGVAYIAQCPENVEVEIVDYDNQEAEQHPDQEST